MNRKSFSVVIYVQTIFRRYCVSAQRSYRFPYCLVAMSWNLFYPESQCNLVQLKRSMNTVLDLLKDSLEEVFHRIKSGSHNSIRLTCELNLLPSILKKVRERNLSTEAVYTEPSNLSPVNLISCGSPSRQYVLLYNGHVLILGESFAMSMRILS